MWSWKCEGVERKRGSGIRRDRERGVALFTTQKLRLAVVALDSAAADWEPTGHAGIPAPCYEMGTGRYGVGARWVC